MIYLGADHAGWALKEAVKKYFTAQNVPFEDLGAVGNDPDDDYPDYGQAVAQKVAGNPDSRGILFCGSGQGICIAANKFSGVRAALAWNTESARLARHDDDANILCLAGRLIDEKTAVEIVETFLKTAFDHVERRIRRIKKISQLEN